MSTTPQRGKRRTPASIVVGVLSLLTGALFIAAQTSKLFRAEAAAAEMAEMPIGLTDWGFVWADTVVMVPAFLIGAVCLFLGASRAGALLVFAGFAVNVYASLFFLIGFPAAGAPLPASEAGVLIVEIAISLLCMAWAGWELLRGAGSAAPQEQPQQG